MAHGLMASLFHGRHINSYHVLGKNMVHLPCIAEDVGPAMCQLRATGLSHAHLVVS